METLKNSFSGMAGRQLRTALLMGGPAFILLAVFLVWPFYRGVSLSRTNQKFDGSEARSVGWDHYRELLSVNLIRLPDLPEELPDRAPPVGWYKSKDGELIFRWRPANLDQIGLDHWEAYEIAQIIHVPDQAFIPSSMRDGQYAIIAQDPRFWKALLHNFYFVLIVVPIQTALAMLLAILINQKLTGMNFFRTIYFSPVVTAMAVIAVVWAFLYNPQFGLINQMLEFVSGGKIGPYQWLDDSKMAMPAIMIMSIWQGVGFQMIIFLAGLQDIPEDLYEAAGIDGAGVFAKFRYVTFPMLRNTMVFVILTTTILAFRLFDQVQVMTPDGGPNESTSTIVWYAIRKGWRENEVGYASAISVLFVVLVLIISVLQRGFIRSESALD